MSLPGLARVPKPEPPAETVGWFSVVGKGIGCGTGIGLKGW